MKGLKTLVTQLLLIFIVNSLYGNDWDLSTRPDTIGVATKVVVSVYVIDIENIDNLKQNFTSDFMVFCKWKDERLKNGPSNVKLENIWWPNANVLNGRNLNKLMPEVAEVDKDGTVLYRQRYYGNLAVPLDLRNFPFDKQELSFSIITMGNTPETIDLYFDEDNSGFVEHFSNSDWDIKAGEGFVDVFKAYSSSKKHQEFKIPISHFTFKATRHVFYYIWKVIVPLLVIVMMSWAVFYFDPIEQVAPQIGLAATSILTLIAFLFSLGKILPPIAYLTKIDFFVYTSLALVFLAFSEAVLTIKLAGSGNITKAKRIDRTSRWIFPLLFIMILILFAI